MTRMRFLSDSPASFCTSADHYMARSHQCP
jgi:hypothetical protein